MSVHVDDFTVYRYYLAIRLHFTNDKYDIFEMNGRVRATRKGFEEKSGTFPFKRLAKKLDEKDIVNFFVANFSRGDRYGGAYTPESEKTFADWKRRIEALTYTFTTDLSKLVAECERVNKGIGYITECNGQHPLLLFFYLGGDISIETLVLFESVGPFIDRFDASLQNDLIWLDVSRLIKKYRPFLKFDQKKIQNEYSRVAQSLAA